MSPVRRFCAVGVVLLVALGAGACTQDEPDSDSATAGATETPGTTDAPDLPTWTAEPGLSVPRDDFATAVVGTDIWAFGGLSGDRGIRLDSVEVFDTEAEEWSDSDVVMPEGLASFEATAIGKDIYVFGGFDADSVASDFSSVLDTSTGRWRELPPLPVGRYAHTVTLHDGLIYVIGGEGADGLVSEVDIFDPDTDTWSTGADLPRPRGGHRTVSGGDLIYVLGGFLDGAPSDLTQSYDPATDSWQELAPVPEPINRAGAAVLDGKLWVSLHEFSAVLDLESGTWSPANPLTVPRHGLGYIVVGSSIYGIGGCTESPLRDVRTVDVLDLA